MTWRGHLLLALLAGCGVTDDVGPHTFSIVGDLGDRRTEIEVAAAAWSDLDMTLVPEGGDVVVSVVFDRYLTPNWGVSDRETDTVYLAPQLWEQGKPVGVRAWFVAHELGHVLLDTSEHLRAPRVGIMNPTDRSLTVTDDDRWLACQVIGRCP